MSTHAWVWLLAAEIPLFAVAYLSNFAPRLIVIRREPWARGFFPLTLFLVTLHLPPASITLLLLLTRNTLQAPIEGHCLYFCSNHVCLARVIVMEYIYTQKLRIVQTQRENAPCRLVTKEIRKCSLFNHFVFRGALSAFTSNANEFTKMPSGLIAGATIFSLSILKYACYQS